MKSEGRLDVDRLARQKCHLAMRLANWISSFEFAIFPTQLATSHKNYTHPNYSVYQQEFFFDHASEAVHKKIHISSIGQIFSPLLGIFIFPLSCAR
jgi:hypothetical protein